MKLQMLVSAVSQDVELLAEKMNMEADTLIVNQCDSFAYEEYLFKGHKVAAFSMKERGVGLSRNTALMRAEGDIIVFSDEDIVYDKGYAETICKEFAKTPEADLILFNVRVDEARRTYWNEKDKRVRWYNCGRYPAYSIAARTESLRGGNVCFSLLFGGGARYSNGEDSLFLKDCLKRKLKIFASCRVIGEEILRTSTWFNGYHDKFFADRGVLYYYLYGKMAVPMAVRFLMAHRGEMCGEIGVRRALSLMKSGIRSVRR